MVKAKELKSSAWDSHTTEEAQQLNIKYDLTKENKNNKILFREHLSSKIKSFMIRSMFPIPREKSIT